MRTLRDSTKHRNVQPKQVTASACFLLCLQRVTRQMSLFYKAPQIRLVASLKGKPQHLVTIMPLSLYRRRWKLMVAQTLRRAKHTRHITYRRDANHVESSYRSQLLMGDIPKPGLVDLVDFPRVQSGNPGENSYNYPGSRERRKAIVL